MNIPQFIRRTKLTAKQLNRLVDAINATTYITQAIGDGESHTAAEVLNITTLAELHAYDNGRYSFATSITQEWDFLVMQAALNDGGFVKGVPGKEYVLNETVLIKNGTVAVDMRGCRLSWEGMNNVTVDPTNLVQNHNFAAGSTGWQNTALSPRTDVTFNTGAAVFTDPPINLAGGNAHFGQFGQQLSVPAGRYRVRAKLVITEGASRGKYGARVLGMGFYKDGPGQGGWPWGNPNFPISNAGNRAFGPFDGEIYFDVEFIEPLTAWLTFSGFNSDWRVEEVYMQQFNMNYAIWATGDFTGFGARYDESTWHGGEIKGPRIVGDYYLHSGPTVNGVLHKSFRGESSRCNFIETHFRNFYNGVTLSDQSFLNRFTACTFGYCDVDVYFPAGTQNAGENFRFTDCILFNSKLAVLAEGGAEWNFTGCSIDYTEKLVVAKRGALLNFTNHHFEFQAAPTRMFVGDVLADFVDNEIITGGISGATARVLDVAMDAPQPFLNVHVLTGTFEADEPINGDRDGVGVFLSITMGDYMMECRDGSTINIVSGELLQAGSSHRGAEYFALVESALDTIAFGNTWTYNMLTASGTWAYGAGRVSFLKHLNPGNALLPKMILRNGHMDAFGGTGDIAGPNSPTGMSLRGPADNVGFMYGAYGLEGNAPTARNIIPWEQAVEVDTAVYRNTVAVTDPDTLIVTNEPTGSLRLEYNIQNYNDNAELRIYIPVSPDKVVLDEYFWSKPDAYPPVVHGPWTSGVPTAEDTVTISTTAGESLIYVEDKRCQWIGGNGPGATWGVTLSGVTGNPGGISNAVINAAHTVVERISAFIYTIDTGVVATTSQSNVGGTAITVTYDQTTVRIYDRRFWVNVVGFDNVMRPIIGQDLFQWEVDFDVGFAATPEWQQRNAASWYAENFIPSELNSRYGRGRAPSWATHWCIVINWQNMRFVDPTADTVPLYLTSFYANVL